MAIYGRDTNDCPILPELVKKTAEAFKVDEVSADKQYLSRANVDAIIEAGGVPYIAFKSNITGGVGGAFEKMFHAYCMNREEYMNHYHKRSNAESTFSGVKRLFGDFVRSKTDVAMINETLCKLLCYNITCVIHSQWELGIEATFWPEEESEKPDVIPLFPTEQRISLQNGSAE